MTSTKRGSGNPLTLTAPGGGVVSGVPVAIGGLFVVPIASAAAGELFSGEVEGEHELACAAGSAFAEGDTAHFNAGLINITAVGTKIGYVVKAKASAATTTTVVLMPS